MVTLILRPEQIVCNKCEKQIGTYDEDGEFTQSPDVDTFMRNRIYDVDHNGKRFDTYEFEIDLCSDCTKQRGRVIKKFKLTKSKVRPSETSTRGEQGE